jgi:hypothetical protein
MQKTITDALDQYSIFDFFVVTPSQAERDALLLMINDEVWSRFIEQRLPFLLTKAQLQEFSQIMKQQQKLEVALQWLQEIVPNVAGIVADYSRDVKAEQIESQLVAQLKHLEQQLATSPDATKQQALEQLCTKVKTALRHIDNQSWDMVYQSLHQDPPVPAPSRPYPTMTDSVS